jgi:O-antigen ligase
MKLALAAIGVVTLSVAMVATRRPRLVLLVAWIVSLTYNRQYFTFEAVAGDNGAQGPYWIVSDAFLLALLALWAYDTIVGKRAPKGRQIPVHFAVLPLLFAGLLSALGADRPDWSIYELSRSAKVIVILLWVRANFGREEWIASAAALTLAAVLQAGLGTAEVATKRSGVLGVLGLSQPAADVPEQLQQQNFYGWHRATGTMNHPPNLACYLLLIVPLPVALSFTAADRRIRAVCALVSVVTLVGLACTLSRWPWLLGAGQLVLLVLTLTAMRLVPVQRTLGLAAVAGFAGLVVLLPLTDFIVDRMTRDLRRSVEFRENENNVALAMFADHPMTGVGLNNYILHLNTYGSEMVWALDSADIAVKQLRVRFIAAPQNGFLLPLAEMGMAGLLAFLFYLLSVVLLAMRAIANSTGWHRAAVSGLFIGILGVIAQQVVDYSFWVDPVFYSFALVVAMIATAPVLAAPRAGEMA